MALEPTLKGTARPPHKDGKSSLGPTRFIIKNPKSKKRLDKELIV